MAAANGQQPVVLTSWKEIASYLGRGVRTVQRWELHFGLPVRRPNQRAKGIVYASREELDQWLSVHWTSRNGEPKVSNNTPTNTTPTSAQTLLQPSIQASRQLHGAMHLLMNDVRQSLESANEELHTVNEEMQHRNEQLSMVNNDLTNLLNSVNLPIVMLGPELSVRRFTPEAAKVLGLTATDIGRPITRLKLKAELEDLEQKMLDVIAEVRPQQYRMRDSAGDWRAMRITPYRTADNRIDGVVLSVLTFDEPQGSKEQPARRQQATKSKSTARGRSNHQAKGRKRK